MWPIGADGARWYGLEVPEERRLMAKVYAAPLELGDPPDFDQFIDADGRYDFTAHREAEEAWVASVQEAARQARPNSTKTSIVGEVVRFPAGDGYAVYVVWNTNPVELVWCPVGDAWSIPEAHARGLRASDLRELVARDRRLAELFGSKS
jgi:hypothetical protein